MTLKKIQPGTPQSRDIVFETRLVSEQLRTVDFVASNQNVDRYRTRLKGWKLDNYRKCPVVLFGHNKNMPPIGRALDVHEGADGNLRVRIQFAPKETYEFADTCYKLIRDGYMPGISVGFTPTRTQFDEENEIMDLLDNELFELSSVPVPGNPDSLAMAHRDGLIPDQYRDFFTYNRSAKIEGIDGVDMEQLRAMIHEWISTPEPEIEEPEAPTDSEEREAPTPMAIDERLEEVTRDRDQLVQDLDATTRSAYVAEAALRTIAALVDFDLSKLADERAYSLLCAAVQENMVRAGAVLSQKNKNQLQRAVDLIEGVLGSSEKEDSDEDDMMGEMGMEAPQSEERSNPEDPIARIEQQLASLAETMQIAIGTQAGRAIVAETKQAANPLDMILARIEGVQAK